MYEMAGFEPNARDAFTTSSNERTETERRTWNKNKETQPIFSHNCEGLSNPLIAREQQAQELPPTHQARQTRDIMIGSRAGHNMKTRLIHERRDVRRRHVSA